MRRLLGLIVLSIAAIVGGEVWAASAQEANIQRNKAMLTAGRAGLCGVRYYFKRPEDEKRQSADDYFSSRGIERSHYQQFIDRQRSLLTTGVLLDDAGHVLVSDLAIEPKRIARIEIVRPDGERYLARVVRVLDRAPGIILNSAEPLRNWRAPSFVRQERLDEPCSISLTVIGSEWRLAIGKLLPSYAYDGGDHLPDRYFGFAGEESWGTHILRFRSFAVGSDSAAFWPGTYLICNKDGAPIGGAAYGWPIDAEQRFCDWQHERLLNGPGVADLAAQAERIRAEYGASIYKIRLLYRQRAEARRGAHAYHLLRHIPHEAGGREKEWTTFGLAISPRQLLVPYPITREQAAKIEAIEVAVGEKSLQGEFLGAFMEVGAFLVGVVGDDLPSATALDPTPPPQRVRLFFTVAVEERFGEKHLEIARNRWLHESRGYKDRYHIAPIYETPVGAWILSADGKVLGVHARQRMEAEELGIFVHSDLSGAVPPWEVGQLRIFWASELLPMLSDPAAHFDRHIRRRSEEETLRLPWLGVEFEPITPELARQLRVERWTKDGSIGLRVNRVYKESPAQRIGVSEGDILLRIETHKRPYPIELTGESPGIERYSHAWLEGVDYQYMEEVAETHPRWKPRANYLTLLLRAIGEGERIKLVRLHAGEEITSELTIEIAPPDFASAKKYRNRELGITVKDLTYEVRAALQLEDERKAIVISNVEPGSPAHVAQVRPFELITAIDGEPVASAEEFGARIRRAIESRKRNVRLTVELLGRSRLADLELEQAIGADEERIMRRKKTNADGVEEAKEHGR